ncbi:hypothetical protein CH253_17865 [Rhodococcus sp. 06-156-3C]|uniref:hypothetical protein n=1 Tax=Nocardiaceae TaxID=85025 RepID=UPI000522FA82|nr:MULTISPECIES: hypothetical protein [Rhodococcus]OZD18327.1 hypothetical protein CH280_07190 [Rhodococcus sp. 06-156-4C]OZD18925.1 hypothetical protein CH253_17865 [Rhodococcus sp. 06-156-3C]OZD22435.1 hypothetical protein CH248_09450 [Rhodococcus sp. 06-156-4a]OZD34019.1 hypothetical protein CH247_07980 [Rhodococcus sp. 06-156-3b]OZD38756.1 hypothetical protein CH284_06400 [Rhodococcus sp. 06-156-3]
MNTSEHSTSVHRPRPTSPGSTTLLSVEIATLDQHGGPGFVHTRGHFYTHSTAARFAITQAEAVTALREADELAVTINREGEGYTETDVLVVGSTGEIACALAAIPNYAAGVRGAELSPPDYVRAAAAAVLSTRAPLPDGHERVDVLEVQVRSVRPDPLPDSTTVLGDYPAPVARQVAGELVDQLTAAATGRMEGAVTEIDARSIVLVAHSVALSDTDTAAVQRYGKITRIRANLAALDSDAAADEVLDLVAEHQRLHAHNVRRTGETEAAEGSWS